jgi:S-formylglutathione hydrolase
VKTNCSGLFRRFSSLALLFILVLGVPTGSFFGQSAPERHGSVERIKVHGKSLEGNLEGDSPDRDVSVYLPQSYKSDARRRYPVVYMLHGYADSDDNWFGSKQHPFVNAPATIDRAIASGAREMIVVMPNANTVYGASRYSTSATVGDWEGFVTQDLVSNVDTHYRTLPDRMSRGLAGHSMGGYGTLRLGMKYPQVYSAIYALSSCCLAPTLDPQNPALARALASIHSAADFGKDDLASAAAWSSNPKNPPLYFDLPIVDGKLQPIVVAKWHANAPLAMVDQYVPNLKKIHAIGMDIGSNDEYLTSNRQFADTLTTFGVTHTFETYEGTHISGIENRLEMKVIPFFSANLSFVKPTSR